MAVRSKCRYTKRRQVNSVARSSVINRLHNRRHAITHRSNSFYADACRNVTVRIEVIWCSIRVIRCRIMLSSNLTSAATAEQQMAEAVQPLAVLAAVASAQPPAVTVVVATAVNSVAEVAIAVVATTAVNSVAGAASLPHDAVGAAGTTAGTTTVTSIARLRSSTRSTGTALMRLLLAQATMTGTNTCLSLSWLCTPKRNAAFLYHFELIFTFLR